MYVPVFYLTYLIFPNSIAKVPSFKNGARALIITGTEYNEMWLNESIFIKNKFTFLAFYFPYLFN